MMIRKIFHICAFSSLLAVGTSPALAQVIPGQALPGSLQTGQNTIDRAAERVIAQDAGRSMDRLTDRLASQAADTAAGNSVTSTASPASLSPVPPLTPSPMAQLPERLPINDSNGNPVFVEVRITPTIRVMEREWIMLINADQRQLLINQAPRLMQFLEESSSFEALNSFLLRFRVPADLDADEAIRQLLPEQLRNLIDRNHIYSAQSDRNLQGSLLSLPMSAVCGDPVSVGVIDSAVQADHPAFTAGGRKAPVVSRAFIDQRLSEPYGHGTAVAGVLIGKGEGLVPVLPNGTVYSASVMYAQDVYNQGASVLHLMQALDWLISIDELQVINISMTGPPNRLLEQGIAAAQRRGKIIVAAAGNEGPFAPALYPAAYEGVVAATAVTVDSSIYRWANQGEHVNFAALGVSVPTARADGSIGGESGTSMAAPVVSAFLACELMSLRNRNGSGRTSGQNGDNNINQALDNLKSRAIDLGSPGHDPVFGHGLLHP